MGLSDGRRMACEEQPRSRLSATGEAKSNGAVDRVQQTLQMDRQEIQWDERGEWHFCRAEVTNMSKSFGIPWSEKVWIAFQDDTEKLCNFSVTVLS